MRDCYKTRRQECWFLSSCDVMLLGIAFWSTFFGVSKGVTLIGANYVASMELWCGGPHCVQRALHW